MGSVFPISTPPEYTKPKDVGLMFFSLEPEKFFLYAQIIEQTFKGPLHQQLRSALLYIRNTVLTERVQKLPDVAEDDSCFNSSGLTDLLKRMQKYSKILLKMRK